MPMTGGAGSRTMLGFMAPPMPAAQSVMTQPMPSQAIAPQQQPVHGAASRTMLGVAIPGIAPIHEPPQQPQPLGGRTMLGVAVPGIAPIHEPQQGRAPVGNTMLGVAAPGIAPTNQGGYAPTRGTPRPAQATPSIVPAPAPLVDEALPDAPVIVRKTGVPLALVAGIGGGVLLVTAVVVGLLVRGPVPLVASAKLSPEGKEQLHLVCDGCVDGTTATLGDAKATFANHQADVEVASPLVVGENPVSIRLDRPGIGRDEKVSLVVPVSYRIRADLSQINATPPALLIHLAVTPGDTVELDGKPVTLDASGAAIVSIDLTSEVNGEGDGKTIDRKLGYVVTHKKGDKSTGDVSAKVSVLPLHIDAPGPRATIEGQSLNVAGRTAKGTQVTINGALAAVNDDGTFGVKAPAGADVKELVVRAQSKTGTDSAARFITIPIKHSDSLTTEAASLEKKSSLGFDALVADLNASTGKPIIVEGRVLEARLQNHGTVMVVDDKRGCSKRPCVVRVLYGGETPVAPNDEVRAFGAVRGAFTAKDAPAVPEVSADFILKGNFR